MAFNAFHHTASRLGGEAIAEMRRQKRQTGVLRATASSEAAALAVHASHRWSHTAN
jgi:hypothetical protein